jgi:hypothetical protein
MQTTLHCSVQYNVMLIKTSLIYPLACNAYESIIKVASLVIFRKFKFKFQNYVTSITANILLDENLMFIQIFRNVILSCKIM